MLPFLLFWLFTGAMFFIAVICNTIAFIVS